MPDPSILFAMALFALTTSATPGPVNIIGAMSGAHYGLGASLAFVTGATVIFVALLLALGTGAIAGIGWIEVLAKPLTWIGAAYLIWLAWRIAGSDGPGQMESAGKRPGFMDGIMVQGLNPKAWFVIMSALTTFVLPLTARGTGLIAFAGLYLVICWLLLAAWAWFGAALSHRAGRGFNRLMALLLVMAVLWMLAESLIA